MWKSSEDTYYCILQILDLSFKVLTLSQCSKYRCSIQHSRCYKICVRHTCIHKTNAKKDSHNISDYTVTWTSKVYMPSTGHEVIP